MSNASEQADQIRAKWQAELNALGEKILELSPKEQRDLLEKVHGQVWNTKELQEDFEVHGFAAPVVVVTRKSDRVKGTMVFYHMPRYYYDFNPS